MGETGGLAGLGQKKMPVSPFDDPGKSHPFINLTDPFDLFYFVCNRELFIIDHIVKVTNLLTSNMDENT